MQKLKWSNSNQQNVKLKKLSLEDNLNDDE
jgi:hypothetical protein